MTQENSRYVAGDAASIIDARLRGVYDLFPEGTPLPTMVRNMADALCRELRELSGTDSDCDSPEWFGHRMTEHSFRVFEANFSFLLSQIGQLDPGFSLDCAKGCWTCCHVHLTVMPHEAIHIARRLLDTLPEERLQSLRSHCREVAVRAERTSLREVIFDYRIPCPLLDEGVCSIYDFRPLACRSWVSQDVRKCIESFESGNRVEVPQNAMLMSQKEICYAANAACLIPRGMSNNITALFVALDALLEDWRGVTTAWMNGEPLPGEIGDVRG